MEVRPPNWASFLSERVFGDHWYFAYRIASSAASALTAEQLGLSPHVRQLCHLTAFPATRPLLTRIQRPQHYLIAPFVHAPRGCAMRILGLTTVLLLCATASSSAADREFDVNTADDLHDLNPGDGICAANASGDQCSLRAALEEARLVIDSLGVLIRVPLDTYVLSLGQLELDRGGVTVRGMGQGNTVVDGSSSSRIVAISGRDARLILFEGLTLRNGWTGTASSGGGVYIDSEHALVTFSSVTIEDNIGTSAAAASTRLAAAS